MSAETSYVTRRDFLRGTAGLFIAAAFGDGANASDANTQRPRVVVIRNRSVLGPGGDIDSRVLQSMLDGAVQPLLDQNDPLKAWRALFMKTDVVGVKSNAWRFLPTPNEMEQAIRRRLLDIGIPDNAIAVDDRGVLDNPIFARATALINVRPVRTHHWSGVGTCLKNYIMFAPTPSAYHGEACSDLGKIWTLPQVKGKTRLNILVALTPLFYGRGPHSFDRRYVWPYKGIIVGTDPVAVDAVGAELLRLKRVAYFGDEKELDVQPVHIVAADRKYRLGVSDLSRIDIVRLGWDEEILI